MARIWPLKGVCYNAGHDWKDGLKRGEEIFVYPWTLPTPYAPGQHPRIGNTCWSAEEEHFRFKRASIGEVVALIPTMLRDLRALRQAQGGQ